MYADPHQCLPPSATARVPVMQYPDGACRRCHHSTSTPATALCQHPQVIGRGAPMPVSVARGRGGPCGLEAWHHEYRRLPR